MIHEQRILTPRRSMKMFISKETPSQTFERVINGLTGAEKQVM